MVMMLNRVLSGYLEKRSDPQVSQRWEMRQRLREKRSALTFEIS
jgi:hypothetical protein